jgi:hypothetical protein
MRTNFFCAESSRKAGEDAIANALDYDLYILVECPTPWKSDEFESRFVPKNLRDLVKEVEEQYDKKFLLIYNDKFKQDKYTRVIIFSKKEGFLTGYNKQEFHLSNIEQVAPLIRKYLIGDRLNILPIENTTRDILICTHGSHDKCCAKYGDPFYRQALKIVSELSLQSSKIQNPIRIWRSSHFGGHRFAPTAIDFPEGRYYGRLDRQSFTSILTKTGNIQDLKNIYRGWGILPPPIQVLERELMFMYGWDWFSYKVFGRSVEQNTDESFNRVELSFEKPNNQRYCYRAEIVADKKNILYLKGSCDSIEGYYFPQYTIQNLIKVD